MTEYSTYQEIINLPIWRKPSGFRMTDDTPVLIETGIYHRSTNLKKAEQLTEYNDRIVLDTSLSEGYLIIILG